MDVRDKFPVDEAIWYAASSTVESYNFTLQKS